MSSSHLNVNTISAHRASFSSERSNNSSIHSKLAAQMTSGSQNPHCAARWASWQQAQIDAFHTTTARVHEARAATPNESNNHDDDVIKENSDDLAVRRHHPHLHRVAAWGRRVRG
ncbi:uncharacterized protein AB675_6576 [Cyphellophora attinorum]|uniref:Uncharacterized protein n=1 Tax=Cyphellophora attinorum TaxID=1664694 RepID=A0A0N1H999_9EURO|nr:uncharacterized protein AB675_6576 [Phialophora attinorum]KPI44035.1 hypothetical protein AB675_6576 [Phialophora attinorum]